MDGIVAAIAWAAGIFAGATQLGPAATKRVLRKEDGQPAANIPPALIQLLIAALPILLTLIGCPVPDVPLPSPLPPAPIVIPQQPEPTPAALPGRVGLDAQTHLAAWPTAAAPGMAWTLTAPPESPVSVAAEDASASYLQVSTPAVCPDCGQPSEDGCRCSDCSQPVCEAPAVQPRAPAVAYRQPAAACRAGYCRVAARPRVLFWRR